MQETSFYFGNNHELQGKMSFVVSVTLNCICVLIFAMLIFSSISRAEANGGTGVAERPPGDHLSENFALLSEIL